MFESRNPIVEMIKMMMQDPTVQKNMANDPKFTRLVLPDGTDLKIKTVVFASEGDALAKMDTKEIIGEGIVHFTIAGVISAEDAAKLREYAHKVQVDKTLRAVVDEVYQPALTLKKEDDKDAC